MNYRPEVCHVPDENSIIHDFEVHDCRDVGDATEHRHQHTVDNESGLLAQCKNNSNLQHKFRKSYIVIYGIHIINKLTINNIIIII